MINYETYCKIRLLQDQHLNLAQIAKAVGLDERTVAHWIKAKKYQPRKQPDRASKLDPFKPQIQQLLAQHAYSGTQILRMLRESGYQGGKSILNGYLLKIRPKPKTAYLTLNFESGECAQVDWGEFGSVQVGHTKRRLSFFVMVLCHSRMLYVRFTVGQAMEHFLDCHQKAFEFFGGVPKRIMVDNLKCAVLRRVVGNVPVLNPRYREFADHYGFKISPCNVAKGNEKGRVENAVGYIKKNLLNGLSIHDFSIMEPTASEWMSQVANVRIHGRTRQRPVDLFEQEKKTLQPLPLLPADTGVSHSVRANSCFRVILDTNRYSVPSEFASTRLKMVAYADELYFYHNMRLITRHPRSYDRDQDYENPDHVRTLLQQRGRARHQKLLAQFLRLCPEADAYHKGLEQRHLNIPHHIRQVMALLEIYGESATSRAIRDCVEMSVFSSSYVCNLLEQRARKVPEPTALHLTRREDLLDLEIPQPNLDIYETPEKGSDDEEGEANAATPA